MAALAASVIYVYTNIPGAGKGWYLGIDALSRQDAAQYVRNVYHGGKFVIAVKAEGKLLCDCIATTSARQTQIHEHFERWLNETDQETYP